jgi:hypothetical protein
MPDDDTRRELRNAQIKKARAAVNRGEPVTDVLTPLMAVINTRSAHGVLGMDELRIALGGAMPKCDLHVVKVRVWPQPLAESNGARAVSMSWWLSSPVQRHLHQQTEGKTNQNQNEDRLQAVWNAMKMTSSCAKP